MVTSVNQAVVSQADVGEEITANVSWDGTGPFDVSIDFGDGDSDFLSMITVWSAQFKHTYAASGTFTIQAIVFDYMESNSASDSDTIQVQEAPPELVVDLTANPTSGQKPLPVTFTVDINGGTSPYDWSLDFGDGSTPESGTRVSTGPFDVPHTYQAEGTFTATVTVTDALGIQATPSIVIGIGSLWDRLKAAWNNLTAWQKILIASSSLVGGAAAAGYAVARRSR